MMFFKFYRFLLLVGLTLALANVGYSAETPPEMVEMARLFRIAAREYTLQYSETVASLPNRYHVEVAAMRDRYQQQGDLDGVLAVANELKRFAAAMEGERDPFELTPEMPPSAIVRSPLELRRLQEQYLKRFTDAATQRRHDTTELAKRYITNLQVVQSDLTRAGRFEEAIVVKSEIERLQQGMNDGSLMRLVERMTAELGAPPPATDGAAVGNDATEDGVPIYGHVPAWIKWEFAGSHRFAREQTQYNHPDLPEELSVSFNEKRGRGNFKGRCYLNAMQVGMVRCHWFGKALLWHVADPANLNATFNLSSRHISAGEAHGPSAQLALLVNGRALRAINVNLQERETVLRVAKDPNSNRCALMWPHGKITETFELPANNARLSLLLGITVRNPGELCDTTVVMQ